MGLISKNSEEEVKPTRQDYAVLRAPLFSEKSSMLGGGAGTTVAFRVHPRSSKDEIKRAVERIYSVEVAKVRTCNYLGKLKRTLRAVGRRASFKKAYVSLKEGHSIDLVEGL